jgi:hypothetical protein
MSSFEILMSALGTAEPVGAPPEGAADPQADTTNARARSIDAVRFTAPA